MHSWSCHFLAPAPQGRPSACKRLVPLLTQEPWLVLLALSTPTFPSCLSVSGRIYPHALPFGIALWPCQWNELCCLAQDETEQAYPSPVAPSSASCGTPSKWKSVFYCLFFSNLMWRLLPCLAYHRAPRTSSRCITEQEPQTVPPVWGVLRMGCGKQNQESELTLKMMSPFVSPQEPTLRHRRNRE